MRHLHFTTCLVLSACGDATRPSPPASSPSTRPGSEQADDPVADRQGPDGVGGDTIQAVRFDPGTSEATVADTLGGFALHDYLVRASAGQRLTADLRTAGPAVVLVIVEATYDPEGGFDTVQPDEPDDAVEPGFSWSGTLPRDGTYRVRVAHSGPAANGGATSPYALTLRIE